jgi:hypothetical protein
MRATPLTAQPDKSEQIKAEKIAFFTEKLELTADEAMKFWPIYNEFQDKRSQLLDNRRKLTRNYMQHADDMTDKEVNLALSTFIDYHKQEAALLENYSKKLKNVLPGKKVLQVFITEMQFKNYLLRQLRGPRSGRHR